MNDEFYIGWEDKAAPAIRKTIRRTVAGWLFIALIVPVTLAVSQRMIGTSVFEWGNLKKFTGVLKLQPYPHLLVPRPDAMDMQAGFSTYYLVAQFKFGLDREKLAALEGKDVSLQGTLIYRGNETMIETRPEWISASTNREQHTWGGPPDQSLGKQTFTGEIVDSKCWLGVMNPGALTPHRACAIRCISGGIPPVLLVRRENAAPVYLLLVSADGRPVNQQVLDLVAEPVEITGEVVRQDGLLILKSDPSTYRRVE